MQVKGNYGGSYGLPDIPQETIYLYVITNFLFADALIDPTLLESKKGELPYYAGKEQTRKALAAYEKEIVNDDELIYYVWQVPEIKFQQFIRKRIEPFRYQSSLKKLIDIKAQWRYEPQTKGLIKEPLTLRSNIVKKSPTPEKKETGSLPKLKVDQITKNENQKIKKIPPIFNPKLKPFKCLFIPIKKKKTTYSTLCCELSSEPLINAAITPYGYSYNKKSILEFANREHYDPQAEKPLKPEQILNNDILIEIMTHMRNTINEKNNLLLCPISKLPFKRPVLINPFEETGKVLLSLINPITKKPFFEKEKSYNYSSILELQKRHPKLFHKLKITPDALIPNITLKRFLKSLEEAKTKLLKVKSRL